MGAWKLVTAGCERVRAVRVPRRGAVVLAIAAILGVCACDGSGDDDDSPENMAGQSGGGAGSGSSEGAGACAKLCDVMAEVDCVGDDPSTCEDDCAVRWNRTRCTNELRATITCASNSPLTDWECDDMNEANLKAGACDAVLQALVTCGQM